MCRITLFAFELINVVYIQLICQSSIMRRQCRDGNKENLNFIIFTLDGSQCFHDSVVLYALEDTTSYILVWGYAWFYLYRNVGSIREFKVNIQPIA